MRPREIPAEAPGGSVSLFHTITASMRPREIPAEAGGMIWRGSSAVLLQ